MILDERIKQRLLETYNNLQQTGKLPSQDKLNSYYSAFQERFSPDILRNTDGDALLELMHGRPSKDSLVYWLEFKDDDEFPAIFGSISGGSALKFGIFKRKETGSWVTGNSSAMHDNSHDEAINYVRRQRDLLLAGVALIEQLPSSGTDEDYRVLQEQLNIQAADIINLAWVHKYYSLLFPDKLDDYHMPELQRFHLIELLQLPPVGDGRYILAGRYIAIAQELGIPVNHLTTIINEINSAIYRYWRVGTTDGSSSKYWEIMRDKGIVSVGWSELGDLSDLTYDQQSKNRVRDLMAKEYPSTPQVIGRHAQQLFTFVTAVKEGDIVLAADGMTIYGIGRVTEGYKYDSSMDFPHYHPIQWLYIGEFKLPYAKEGLRTSLSEITEPDNQLEIQRIILNPAVLSLPAQIINPLQSLPTLDGWPGRIQKILERKGQVILYGPPGTGKTHWAEQTACELAARKHYNKTFNELLDDDKNYLMNNFVMICTFHPAYGYEDFIEGYRPEKGVNGMEFVLKDGIFKTLCQNAANRPDEQFFLIIDEINRGDIPRIFGELITILEKNKRGKAVTLPLSAKPFIVPNNIFIIGTMNTADRSIALLDAALRRRFGFLELMPDSKVLGNASVGSILLAPWLDALNERIRKNTGRDARNLQVGHSYLLDNHGKAITEMAVLARIIREDIIPLLEEYCYEDYNTLSGILGDSLINRDKQTIKDELFLHGRLDELNQALAKLFPEIITSLIAIAVDAQPPVMADNVDDDNEDEEEDNTSTESVSV
jgi:5-methylcytosine-specific restriction protein B